jgi:hypothetical protein
MRNPEGIQLQHNNVGGERAVYRDIDDHREKIDRAFDKGIIKDPIHIFAVVSDKSVTVSSMVRSIMGDAKAGFGILRISEKHTISKITIVTQDGVVRAQNGKLVSCSMNGTNCVQHLPQ